MAKLSVGKATLHKTAEKKREIKELAQLRESEKDTIFNLIIAEGSKEDPEK